MATFYKIVKYYFISKKQIDEQNSVDDTWRSQLKLFHSHNNKYVGKT